MYTKPTEAEVVLTLTDAVNGSRFNTKEFVNELHRSHRTLQQGVTAAMIAWLRHLSTLQEHQYDLRNAASVEFAKEIKPILDKYPGLPTI